MEPTARMQQTPPMRVHLGSDHAGLDLKSAVELWYADPASNLGIALIPIGPAEQFTNFGSSESLSAATRPALEVCYQP